MASSKVALPLEYMCMCLCLVLAGGRIKNLPVSLGICDGKDSNPSCTVSSIVEFSLLCSCLDLRAWYSMENSVVEPQVFFFLK